jgi:hypothetical protein
MTTIRSIHTKSPRTLSVDSTPGEEGVTSLMIRTGPGDWRAIDVATADLLAALGVDPDWREWKDRAERAEADKRDLIEEGVQLKEKLRASNQTLDHVVRERDELKREHGYAEMGADEWRKRAEAAEAKAVASGRMADAYATRAEAAEAKLARAEAFIASHLDPHHQGSVVAARVAEQLRAALADPEPPFVLPTTVPARIVAVKCSTGDEKELTLFTDGDTTWWADVDDWGPFWTRSQIMDQFTGHRILGADE